MAQRVGAVLETTRALGLFGRRRGGRRGLPYGEGGYSHGELARIRLNLYLPLLLDRPFNVFFVDDKFDGPGFSHLRLDRPQRCAWATGLFGA